MNLIFSSSFKKGLSYATFTLMVVYVFGLVNIEYSSLGISEPLFEITKEIVVFFDVIFWIIVSLLTVELFIAYLKVRDAKTFVKKYWLEILLLVFMPVFAGFKILKLSLKVLKQLKVGKSVFKIIQKLKKSK
ncbi:hypothetical protein [Nitrosopumilus adriaticus]|uniref:Ion transport domain-containing protein n=1 Tax=Nitrosopumilus adriaticus TaxID=1580092 RepID=A0A0D5C4A8_9ARCH|nr:hypothetical protein [Nitrosopumilus adriaticus]AJW71541.1 conserved membrane protein of unknown function [Nitrosopumilus adriaticus]